MRCEHCGYRLWHLKSRRCPECGTEFKPSDFEFVPHAVQFCCPHCNQAYYGTSSQGHLRPVEFDCVSCGRHIHMDEMVLLPTDGVEEEQTKIYQMPWLERKERGLIRAWLATIGMALVSPIRLINTVPVHSPAGPAWLFAILVNLPASLFGPALFVLPMMLGLAAAAAFGGRSGGAGMFLLGSVCWLLGGVVLAALWIGIWSLLTHGILRLTGPTAGPLGRTMHGICYSSGANIISAIPCFGVYIGPIWWLVSAVLMVMEGQRVRGWRAALAVLAPPVCSFLVLTGLWIGFMLWSAGMASRFTATQPSWPSDTTVVLNAVLGFAHQNAGKGPDHAIQLVTGGQLSGFDLLDSDSATQEQDVPVADTTLEKFSLLRLGRQKRVARGVIEALPKGTVAHRLGDFVFTYHGMDLDAADPGLWVVVDAPDPDVNPYGSGIYTTLAVGLADGSVLTVEPADFTVLLAEQNKLRAANNLPPIPDPRKLTHDKPAGREETTGEKPKRRSVKTPTSRNRTE